mgnify:FL=1
MDEILAQEIREQLEDAGVDEDSIDEFLAAADE